MPPWYETLLEADLVPDALIRLAIRHLCAARLREEEDKSAVRQPAFLDAMQHGRVAECTGAANEQHYEVPEAFFRLVLGPQLKYSACWWPEGVDSLEKAEEVSLRQVEERAKLADGQRVLELGCGWGSLTLWMAARFPNADITAVSNSSSQRVFIETAARNRGLANVRVVTTDMNHFEPERRDFDRVISIEMFEHMRNWSLLLRRIAEWTTPEALLFVHVFVHKTLGWHFEPEDGWMARHFFTGGIMPSRQLMGAVNSPWNVECEWTVDGTHYQRTLEAWLQNLDARKSAALEVLGQTYGKEHARAWLVRWRVFFMACSGLFGFRGGREWGVAHYRLAKTVRVQP